MEAGLAILYMRVDHAKLKLFHFYYNPTPTPKHERRWQQIISRLKHI